MITTEDLDRMLDRLDGEPADALESQTLEFKSWMTSETHRRKLQAVKETIVAFANAEGGALVLGIADRKRSRREAIHGVGDLDISKLIRDIYDGTDPHILADVQELHTSEGRLILIQVPRGLPPHLTSDGVAKIRIGKESKPLSGSAILNLVATKTDTDHSARFVPKAKVDDLDPEQFELLRRDIRNEGSNPDLAALEDAEILRALGLASDADITLAAVLLLGLPTAIRQHVPQHEVIFMRFHKETEYDVRRDFRGPLLQILNDMRQLFAANHRVTIVETDGFQHLELPDFTWLVVREAMLNALMHRDYFLNQSIQVNLHRDRVEVTSPGGFVGGITPSNVLRHAPVRRNPLLANVFQHVGLVNRAGLGVDRIYDDLLRLGKGVPRYDAQESYVRLIIPTVTHVEFARFVASLSRQGIEMSRDDLIVLRTLITRRLHDRRSAAGVLQLSAQEASDVLISLRKRGFLEVEARGLGARYRLAEQFDHWSQNADSSRDIVFGHEEARDAVLAALAADGTITNAGIREITGYTRNEVVRLTRAMRNEGLISVRGNKRGAHYIRISPKL